MELQGDPKSGMCAMIRQWERLPGESSIGRGFARSEGGPSTVITQPAAPTSSHPPSPNAPPLPPPLRSAMSGGKFGPIQKHGTPPHQHPSAPPTPPLLQPHYMAAALVRSLALLALCALLASMYPPSASQTQHAPSHTGTPSRPSPHRRTHRRTTHHRTNTRSWWLTTGGVRVGDWLIRINDFDCTTQRFSQVHALLADSNQLRKVLVFGSRAKVQYNLHFGRWLPTPVPVSSHAPPPPRPPPSS